MFCSFLTNFTAQGFCDFIFLFPHTVDEWTTETVLRLFSNRFTAGAGIEYTNMVRVHEHG